MSGAPGRNFACNLRVRSAVLYTLSYGSVDEMVRRGGSAPPASAMSVRRSPIDLPARDAALDAVPHVTKHRCCNGPEPQNEKETTRYGATSNPHEAASNDALVGAPRARGLWFGHRLLAPFAPHARLARSGSRARESKSFARSITRNDPGTTRQRGHRADEPPLR